MLASIQINSLPLSSPTRVLKKYVAILFRFNMNIFIYVDFSVPTLSPLNPASSPQVPCNIHRVHTRNIRSGNDQPK